jgi:hypothetical protein
MTTTQIVPFDRGYTAGQRAVLDFLCAEDHGALVLTHFDGEWRAVCPRDPAHVNQVAVKDLQADEIRERLERNPETARTLATQQARVPLTTDALKNLSDEQLKSRVTAAFAGVTEATDMLRAQIIGLSKLYGLDPLFDLMIYQGKPYINYDGRLRKLREAPNFRGETELRPLSRTEKEEWGFDPGDVVIKCTADMGPKGLVTDFGVVRAQGESSPVARSHPQLLAIKRARARVSRVATGIDLPTIIDSSGRVIDVQRIDQQSQPALNPGDAGAHARRRFWATARAPLPDGLGLSERHVYELLGVDSLSDYPGGWSQALSDLTERAADADIAEDDPATTEQSAWPPAGEPPTPAVPAEPADDQPVMITRQRDPINIELGNLIKHLVELGKDVEPFSRPLPAPRSLLLAKIQAAQEAILREEERQQAASDAQRGMEL